MSGDFQIREWRVQPAVNRVVRGDQVIRLEPKVMQVLVCLAEHAGEVVVREALIARVWPDVFVSDDVLHRAVRELRRVFGDSAAQPAYIETIRKRGYRLIPEIAPSALTGSHVTRASGDHAIAGPRRMGLGRSLALLVVLAAGVAAAVLAVATRPGDLAPEAHVRFIPVVSGPLNETDPAMSPDGRRVAFVQRAVAEAGSADIYIRDLATGDVTRVTDHEAGDRMPTWSPDGQRLAFVRTTPDSCHIVIRTLATNHEARAGVCGNVEDPKLAWKADGRTLLSSQAPDLHGGTGWRIALVDIASGARTPLTDPPAGIIGDHSPAVSPDGRYMAFIRRVSGGVSDIYTASINGAHARRITFDDADLTGIDWSADGRSIVFSSDRAGGYSLWRVSVGGGTPALLAGGAARMKHPVVDRAGRRVVYENWNYEINVWRAGQPGRVDEPITRTSELWNLYPQLSPDDSRIAYVSTQSGAHELWVAERDGSAARQLTRTGGAVASPRWSPDGRRIVYLSRGHGGVDVYHVAVESGAIVSVTSTAVTEVAPAFTHDGRRILYGAPDRFGQWQVWSVDANVPADVRLEIPNAVAAQPARDGAHLYFTRPDQPGLWRIGESASPPERLLETIAAANTHGWSIAGDGIYFVEEVADAVLLRRAPFAGGASSQVATLTQFTWPGFSVGNDGAVLYARWDRRESNLMSIQY
jgi:Tol biopolymer transport system component/DNA-binding winged helix-turn-helix (wHTH) protein